MLSGYDCGANRCRGFSNSARARARAEEFLLTYPCTVARPSCTPLLVRAQISVRSFARREAGFVHPPAAVAAATVSPNARSAAPLANAIVTPILPWTLAETKWSFAPDVYYSADVVCAAGT